MRLLGSYLSLLGRVRKLTPQTYFLWVFGGFNLFNVGYLVFSAIAGGGDWGNVILGLTPSWVWRLAIGLAGIVDWYGLRIWRVELSSRWRQCSIQSAQVSYSYRGWAHR